MSVEFYMRDWTDGWWPKDMEHIPEHPGWLRLPDARLTKHVAVTRYAGVPLILVNALYDTTVCVCFFQESPAGYTFYPTTPVQELGKGRPEDFLDRVPTLVARRLVCS